eukprot:3417723-Prymnesium_polylepis.3
MSLSAQHAAKGAQHAAKHGLPRGGRAVVDCRPRATLAPRFWSARGQGRWNCAGRRAQGHLLPTATAHQALERAMGLGGIQRAVPRRRCARRGIILHVRVYRSELKELRRPAASADSVAGRASATSPSSAASSEFNSSTCRRMVHRGASASSMITCTATRARYVLPSFRYCVMRTGLALASPWAPVRLSRNRFAAPSVFFPLSRSRLGRPCSSVSL